jgi:3-ketosteroid 9alpha-monooxygenase subunit A
MENFYSDIYPESWWVLMPATELRPGTARKFDVLGRTLVVYRTESGKLAAMDRFCPHMGVSLAEGKVVGERIVCPFHA